MNLNPRPSGVTGKRSGQARDICVPDLADMVDLADVFDLADAGYLLLLHKEYPINSITESL